MMKRVVEGLVFGSLGTWILGGFFWTMAPGVDLWDPVEYTLAVVRWGIPHAAGYPFFVILMRAGFLLSSPIHEALQSTAGDPVAIRAKLGVVLSGVFLILLVMRITREILSRGLRYTYFSVLLGSVTAGMTIWLMPAVWNASIELETYVPGTVGILLSLWYLIHAVYADRSRWFTAWLMAWFIAILFTAVHLIVVPFLPLVALTGVVLARRRWSREAWVKLVVGIVIFGVTWGWILFAPLAWVGWGCAGIAILTVLWAVGERKRHPWIGVFFMVSVLASSAQTLLWARGWYLHHHPEVTWLNHSDPWNLERWRETLLREGYPEVPVWPRRIPLWDQVRLLGQYTSMQMEHPSGALILLLITVGILISVSAWRTGKMARGILFGFLLIASLGFLILINPMDSPWRPIDVRNPKDILDTDVFWIPFFALLGIWSGLGVAWVAEILSERRWWVARWVWGGGVVLMLGIAGVWMAHGLARKGNRFAEYVGRNILQDVTERPSVLFLCEDNDAFSVYYVWEMYERGPQPVYFVHLPMLNTRWFARALILRGVPGSYTLEEIEKLPVLYMTSTDTFTIQRPVIRDILATLAGYHRGDTLLPDLYWVSSSEFFRWLQGKPLRMPVYFSILCPPYIFRHFRHMLVLKGMVWQLQTDLGHSQWSPENVPMDDFSLIRERVEQWGQGGVMDPNVRKTHADMFVLERAYVRPVLLWVRSVRDSGQRVWMLRWVSRFYWAHPYDPALKPYHEKGQRALQAVHSIERGGGSRKVYLTVP